MDHSQNIPRRRLIVAGLCTATVAVLPSRSPAGAILRKGKREEMSNFTPYLLLNGQCHQAMEFYKACFGGELSITKVKDSPAKQWMPAAEQEKVIHARLRNEKVDISASDWLRPDQTPIRGNMVCLYLSGGSLRELRTVFERLSEGAEVTDPLKEQFFGTYGALNDRFGVRWMFQTDEKD